MDEEVASAILEPHFAAVRDFFCQQPKLDKLCKTKLIVDSSVHDTSRHFAGCRDDGMVINIAPQAVDLPVEQLVAIICHEFGHAADFAYPAEWVLLRRGEKSVRITDHDERQVGGWRKLWYKRSDDQIEWAADGIAYAVTGRKVTYCGSCLVQCFSGIDRPKGLR